MKLKPNYIIIPALIIISAAVGIYFNSGAIVTWYPYLRLPAFTPPGYVFALAWTIIYILTAASALLVWNQPNTNSYKIWLAVAFLVNGFLNAYWCYLFFGLHLFGASVFESIVLDISVLILIIMIYPKQKLAAFLLLPYFAWVSFAVYLMYSIANLN